MKILAVEFSSEQRGIAILEKNGVGSTQTRTLAETVELGGRRAIELVEKALNEAGCKREAIGCIAVGLGPGSYTGIRGAIALAQGWQLGTGVKLLGISSVEAIAAQAQEQGVTGYVSIVVDAQRGEFYLAKYRLDTGNRTEVEPLHIASRDVVEKLIASGELVIGPEASKSFPSAKDVYPAAAALGRLAAQRTSFVSGELLEPIYLRETTFKKAPPPRTIA